MTSRLSIGVLVLDLSGSDRLGSAKIVEANPSASELIYHRAKILEGKRLADLPGFASSSILKRCERALHSGEKIDIKLGHDGGGGIGVLRLRVVLLTVNRAVLTLEDSSGQAAAEQAVRRSEQSFQLLIHSVKDYAIIMMDHQGKILSWNEGAERLKGFRADEIIGKNYEVFFTSEDREAGKPDAQLRKAAEAGQSEDEGWLVKKDGWAFWANTVITALRDEDGRVYGFAQITRDMTERREREESIRVLNEHLEERIEARTAELVQLNEALQSEVRERKNAEEQLRALAARQERVREDERTRLAREIHDALGQMCTALKMDIAWIAKRLPKEQRRLAEKSESALKLVGDLIKSLRRLSAELRPSTLDTLGLVASIEWQAQQFEAHTGIRCQLFLPEKDLALDKERSTAIFRIFQETLTNVARHAGATMVQASLVAGENRIALVTHDNGAGFDPSVVERKGSLGLLGMKERAHLLGGDFKVSSSPGKGTTVVVHIPLPSA
ncbi:MAG TPA: PAS domain S-box protein [Candidatus Aquilonibacter sp.]|nr:PAS domain S-box protein [Candidatus Aquilonibacter sp.]